MHPSPIADALSTMAFGPEVTHGNVVMLPLISRDSAAADPALPPYLALDDALARGDVEVTEVSTDGSVPDLCVVNRGDKATLIVDGEELVGAKQNRIVNLTVFVAAHSALTIPVSCVEAGRWSVRSRPFAAAPRTQYASGRAKRMAQVTACMRADRGYRSDQSEVWADIAEKCARLRVSSPTGAHVSAFAQ